MKTTILLLVCIPYGIDIVFGLNRTDIVRINNECLKEVSADPDKMQELINERLPINEEEKCFMACLQSKMGIINEEGKYDPENLKEFAKFYHSESPEKIEKLSKIADECNERESIKNASEKCELAFLTIECAVELSKKYDYDIEFNVSSSEEK